ncbi:transcription factor IIA, alpha/beta subunit [Hypoxylon argillaceum]|nr:transcription factor IIA, alpha/beta subunit [Hypoxylon argillaceum]
MSNSQVGNIYQQIINDVIAASRVDFEEGGIDETVLEQLRKGWQKKLSQQQLAQFPWDPKPDPPPPAPAVTAPAPQPIPGPSATLPITNGNGYAQSQPPAPQPAPVPMSMPMPMPMPVPVSHSTSDARIKPEPGVKIEPGLEGNTVPQPIQGDANNIAHQRVIAQLQNQYGDRAAASINKLREQPNGGVGQPQNQPQNQQRMVNPSMPQAYPGQYQNNPQQQQYRPNMPHNPAAQQQRVAMTNGQRPPNSQVDGSGDDDGHVGILLQQARNGETTEIGRVGIDNLLHAQIAARAKAMEGGGLMLPLKRTGKGKAVRRHKSSANAGPSQFDGPDDDIKDEDDGETDEDAINSDLDDPDDNVEENEDDEEGGQIMLCMYDKVQRVKNKWKCVLKDGVLNVNGKDYVFHKATGEFEW